MPSLELSIKSVSGTAYVLQVDSSKTIAHIKDMLKEQDSTIHPTASSLIYAGKSLDDSKTLEECNIPNDSTLHYSSGNNTTNNNSPVEPSVKAIPTSSISAAVTKSSSSPARKNRKRCSSKNCLSAPLRNIGDCSFCEGHFCSKHRLLEQHQCVGLKNCKQQLHNRNATKLQQEQTVANKV